jgi:hypothetical protein
MYTGSIFPRPDIAFSHPDHRTRSNLQHCRSLQRKALENISIINVFFLLLESTEYQLQLLAAVCIPPFSHMPLILTADHSPSDPRRKAKPFFAVPCTESLAIRLTKHNEGRKYETTPRFVSNTLFGAATHIRLRLGTN